MKEIGRIVEADSGSCQVEFVRSSACESCGACNRFDGQAMRITMQNTMNAQTGDTVVVEMSAGNVIGASAWAYVFPLAMLVLGAFAGKLLMALLSIKGEWIMAACSLAFAGLAFIILKMLNPYFAKRQGFKPVMVEIIKDEKTTD